jgi:hypothetical protein
LLGRCLRECWQSDGGKPDSKEADVLHRHHLFRVQVGGIEAWSYDVEPAEPIAVIAGLADLDQPLTNRVATTATPKLPFWGEEAGT